MISQWVQTQMAPPPTVKMEERVKFQLWIQDPIDVGVITDRKINK